MTKVILRTAISLLAETAVVIILGRISPAYAYNYLTKRKYSKLITNLLLILTLMKKTILRHTRKKSVIEGEIIHMLSLTAGQNPGGRAKAS